jgi:hypothetical protein
MGTSATNATGPSKLLAIVTSRPAASKTTDLPWPADRTSGTPVMTATHTTAGSETSKPGTDSYLAAS